MMLRRLNENGVEAMAGFLASLSGSEPRAYPEALLTGEGSEDLGVRVEVERPPFRTRMQLAQYIYTRLAKCGLRAPERDRGLWAWLALYWFEVLCPAEKGGARKPGVRARWVPEGDVAWRYYRHLVLGPYVIYAAHADDPLRAAVVLNQPPHKPGDIVEQIASRPQIVTCRAALGAASKLYVAADGSIMRGAGGKGLGSARRLADVLMQFDLTFDLHSLKTEDLLGLLPSREFGRFTAA